MSTKETYVASGLGRFGRRFINFCASISMLYLFAPIFVIVFFSFNNPTSRFNFVWKGFTLKHWVKTFSGGEQSRFFYPDLNNALIRSVIIALISSVIATILGTLLAFALSRYKVKGAGLFSTFLVLPLTTPEVVLGASLFALFLDFSFKLGGTTITFPLGNVTIVLAHVMFCMSYVTLTIKARMRGFDWQLEDAAQDLGATPKKAFFKVTLPIAMPGIFAAFLLSFALSLDDFIITLFVNGGVKTFPIQVFSQSRTSIPPQINVLSTMLLVITSALFIIPNVISVRRAKKLEKNRVIIS
ncbi:MAG: ABC transporter permease [Acidimicrobiia bacterium]